MANDHDVAFPILSDRDIEDWSWCYVDEVFFEPAVAPERTGRLG